MTGGTAQVYHSSKLREVKGLHHFGRAQNSESVHPLDKSFLRFFRPLEVIEDGTLDAECLLPARGSFPHCIFHVGPQAEQNVAGIEDVSGKSLCTGAAKIATG